MSPAVLVVPMLAFALASLPGDAQMRTAVPPVLVQTSSVDPTRQADLTPLIDEIRSRADAFVFLCGGASTMPTGLERRLAKMLDALGMVAKQTRIAVGDGGTHAGIMRAAGQARETSGSTFALIGVAPAAKIPPIGATKVDPNHTHIVAVRSVDARKPGSWGSETETMYWLFGRLAEGRPSVTVVANGGSIVLKEVEANVRAGRPMILVEGSGRAADAIVSLLRGTTPIDQDVARLRKTAESRGLVARSELYRVVPLSAGAAGLRDAILQVIAPAK
jgi:hypothetical protein